MRTVCLFLSLAIPMTSHAQTASPVIPAPAFTASGGFWGLSVRDLGASTQWYSEKLGLRVVMQVPKQNGAAVAVLEGGGLIVELIEHDRARSLSEVGPGTEGSLFVHGIFKVGLIVENYAGLLDALRERQIEIAMGPFPARGNQRANVIVRDNAGNLIQFFAK